jgi:hypothetical protein
MIDKPKEYKYLRQRKVSVWEETQFTILASSEEEANDIVDGLISSGKILELEELAKNNKSFIFEPDSETLLPFTLEYLTYEDNKGSILEVMSDDETYSYYKNEFLHKIG